MRKSRFTEEQIAVAGPLAPGEIMCRVDQFEFVDASTNG